ncbi:hypothetical protein B6U80_01045 [Candidatus Pacearchaeota archaeon ex4484_26]|nr:MAG: hypothetical protein B6U80_01045 [Candidatus Pacearchaeota archaeon ex4484_26]
MNPQRFKKKNKLFAIILMVIVTILTSAGQILLKNGVNLISGISSIINTTLILGFLLYAIALVLTLLALKKGEVSVLYPIMSLAYVWVALLALLFLGESLNFFKILGIITIFLGVSLIGLGGK